jgi:arabinoxylan arabinofuranohydrolase
MRQMMVVALALGLALGLGAAAMMAADSPSKDAPKADTPKDVTKDMPKAPGWPEKYKGTPYKGVPQEIPGRVELENFDEGGINVGFKADNHDQGCSGEKYRPSPRPNICVTNAAPGEQDHFVDGKRYPSETGESYYIGYAHASDWVQCTVNVKKAGVYRVNTTAATEPAKLKFTLSFNDVKKAEVNTDGTKSYHVWKVYDNICTVKLEAGLQVMKLLLGEPHFNYDYVEFVFDEKATAEAAAAPATDKK